MRGVYTITHTTTGSTYVGSSSNIGQRWAYHRSALKRKIHENTRMQTLYDTGGIEGFMFSVVAIIDAGDMLPTEQAYIDLFDKSHCLMNLYKVAGSSKGYKHSEQTRKKISNAIKRRPPPSPETRRKLSLSKMGNPGRPAFGRERRSLTDDQVITIKHMLCAGKYTAQIERLTGVRCHTIARISRGQLYLDVAPYMNEKIAHSRRDGRSV